MSSSPQYLHCFPCGNKGGPVRSRPRLQVLIEPVHQYTRLISLPHACLAAGLLEDVRKGAPVNSPVLADLAERKWGRSVERFWGDAEAIGVTRATADKTAATLRGTVIGWSGPKGTSCHGRNALFALCPDINWALAVLSRCVSDIFFATREPEYSWDKLFEVLFEVDDERIPAATLDGEPWSRFEWKVAGGAKEKRQSARRRSSWYGGGHC